MSVQVIGVPFNSSGHANGVALAPAALRRAGLLARLAAGLEIIDAGDVEVGALAPRRSPRSGLVAQAALITTIHNTGKAVAAAHEAGRFPLVLGGDCPVMLGGLAASRDRYGSVGLVMVDGHEDNYPPRKSLTGEAADCELFLALGLPADGLPQELTALTPLLQPHQVSLLGPRDEATIVRAGVASLRGTVPMHTDVEVIVRGPAAVAVQAAQDVCAVAASWWLHVDLDVLATQELGAVDYPQPGGLSWQQLRDLTWAALAVPGCVGWTVAIYNPDLDPDRSGAHRIVDYLANTAQRLAQIRPPSLGPKYNAPLGPPANVTMTHREDPQRRVAGEP
jgi:arginase